MISERHLAEDFQVFWSEVVPLLTPSFVRLFNEAYREEIVDDRGVPLSAILVGADVVHHDIVSELTFHIARLAHERAVAVEAAFNDSHLRMLAMDSAVAEIKRFALHIPVIGELQLNDAEWDEIRQLCYTYDAFMRRNQDEQVEFSPVIPGAGFLSTCRADLSVGNTLFEIKTVNRNIAGKDIRQLIVYLTLQASTGNRRWRNGGFFNPRKALCYRFPVDHIMSIISGGRSATEVFREIIDFLNARDTQLDTAF